MRKSHIALGTGFLAASIVVACSSSDTSAGTSSSGNASSTSSSSGTSGSTSSSSGTSGASSGTSGAQGIDDASADVVDKDAACGSPGDTGNSKGVGKYCKAILDCIGNSEAQLCATAGDPNATFCTKLCSMGDGASVCGENAQCVCDPGGSQCGCTPTSCL